MSEAAKPADPERALARTEQLADLESLLVMVSGAVVDLSDFGDGPAGRLAYRLLHNAAWLLQLARAGLSVPDLTHRVEGLASTLDGNNRMLRERREKLDALRAEFAACVRALASIRETARRDYTLALMPDVVADSQRALSGPLAAAVLRSQGGEDAKNAQQGVKREPAPPAAAQAGASANAEAQEAIAEGAVLRSPEPAKETP